MKNILIILTFLALGCTPRHEIQNSNPKDPNVNIIEVTITKNDDISFIVKNISKDDVKIYEAERLHIEKMENGAWKSLKILPCPCGAPCAQPDEFIDLEPGGTYPFSWDKYESWCGERNKVGIPETMKRVSETGKYRISIVYSTEQNKQQIFYQYFEI